MNFDPPGSDFAPRVPKRLLAVIYASHRALSSDKIDFVLAFVAPLCEHAFVPKKPGTRVGETRGAPDRPISLKALAAHLSLSPSTLSVVLNHSPGADAISQETKDRIIAAARKFNYRPNFLARSLRAQRSYIIGVMVPELSDGYSSLVASGIEETLMQRGYMYLATTHRHSDRQIELLPRLLWERRVEGLIVVDTPYPISAPLPVVSVSGHRNDDSITNIVLNHAVAAHLGIGHLLSLGHRHIAVLKGQAFTSDTEIRWLAIEQAARELGVPIDPRLVVQLEGDSPSPEPGYTAAQKLMKRGAAFTAVFAFNDISAFGAIRAFQERGLAVPRAVSVVGFDDIWGAAYHIPALTTIRQPLRRMGSLAAETILERIESRQSTQGAGPGGSTLQVEPELVIRESTGPAPDRPLRPRPEADLVASASESRAAR